MKYIRYEQNGLEKWGVLRQDHIEEIAGDIFDRWEASGRTCNMDEIRILPPCRPGKVVAVGLNYLDHAREMNLPIPQNPILFVKLSHTVIACNQEIIIPEGATRVDYEAELAVVIKKTCRNVEPDEADSYILGATCLNDVTERDVQKADGQWMRAKNYETFCPIGPWVSDGLDYNALDVQLRLNGEIRQQSNTRNFIWNVQQLVSFISRTIPLEAGDVVTTGTTSGIGPMKSGDIVEVEIEGIGILRNPVRGARIDNDK